MERNLIVDYKTFIPSFTNAINHLTLETYDGSGETVHPDIIYKSNGIFGFKYWMVNTPYPNADYYKENPSIWCSNDGISWIVPNGLTNPVVPKPIPATTFNSDPCLVFCEDDNKLRIYFRECVGATDPTGDDTIKMTQSSDGVVWSEPVVIVSYISDKHLSPQVAYDSDKKIFIMWLFRHEGGSGHFKSMVRKTSKDGLNFGVDVTCIFPAVAIGIDPWHFNVKYYKGKFIGCFVDTIHGHIYFFESVDKYGKEFKINNIPLLSWGSAGNWDSGMLYQNVLLPLGGVFRLYYTGILGANVTTFLGIAN